MTMIDDGADALPLGREVRVEPGLFIERRCFLAATAGALAPAGILPGAAYARLSPADSISFDEFLAGVLPEAKRLVADVSPAGQDVCLRTLAEHAIRLSEGSGCGAPGRSMTRVARTPHGSGADCGSPDGAPFSGRDAATRLIYFEVQ